MTSRTEPGSVWPPRVYTIRVHRADGSESEWVNTDIATVLRTIAAALIKARGVDQAVWLTLDSGR